MKRSLTVIVIALLLAAAAPALAQESGSIDKSGSIRSPSDLYPVRVDVLAIYAHAQGYRVVYRRGSTSVADVYIPITWFTVGGRAVMYKGTGMAYPYMMVYYRSDGSFSHVKLYVQASMTHKTWGQMTGDPGDRFKVDTIKLEF